VIFFHLSFLFCFVYTFYCVFYAVLKSVKYMSTVVVVGRRGPRLAIFLIELKKKGGEKELNGERFLLCVGVREKEKEGITLQTGRSLSLYFYLRVTRFFLLNSYLILLYTVMFYEIYVQSRAFALRQISSCVKLNLK